MPRKVDDKQGMELELHVLRQCSKQIDRLKTPGAQVRVLGMLTGHAEENAARVETVVPTEEF